MGRKRERERLPDRQNINARKKEREVARFSRSKRRQAWQPITPIPAKKQEEVSDKELN